MDSERKSEMLVLGASVLWASFPVIAKLTYNSISSLHTAGLSALFAALFFVVISYFKRNFPEWKNRAAYKPIILTTVLNGILFYGLLFTGLKYTSAGNLAVLSLIEVFFAIFILRAWHKEILNQRQILGSAFMVLGAALVLLQNGFSFNKGDLIIVAAMAIPPLGNYYAKEARNLVSSSTILLFRNLTSGIVLFAAASFLFPLPTAASIKNSLGLLLISGFVLFGLVKIMWLEAMRHLLIGKGTSLFSITPVVTILFAFIALKEVPTIGQSLGLVSALLGVYLLTVRKKQLLQ